MSISVTLPNINGSLEAGIAVGTDPSLSATLKLPIAGVNMEAALKNACAWAFCNFRGKEEKVHCLYVCGAYIAIRGQLCQKVGTTSDGDWDDRTVASDPTADEIKKINEFLTEENIRRALTIIVATKANWWQMNHHVGQGEVAGYVKKVLGIYFPGAIPSSAVEMAHTIGHWCSTITILNKAGVAGIKNPTPLPYAGGIDIELSDDAKLRFQGFPAGTHRLVVAFEAAKRLVRSPLAAFCPAVADFSAIPPLRASVNEALSSYHIGASYLTGVNRALYSDTQNDAYLGRLGTYMRAMFPKATLTASPHLTQVKVESYEDYSPEWHNTLTQYKLLATQNASDAMRNIHAQALSAEDLQALKAGFTK